MTGVLLRREDMERCTQRSSCDAAGDIAGPHLQARSCRGLLATTRRWKRGMARFLPQRNQRCQHLDFRPPASTNVMVHFCRLKPSSTGQPQDTDTGVNAWSGAGPLPHSLAELGSEQLKWTGSLVAKGMRLLCSKAESGFAPKHSESMCKARQGAYSALQL